jgi:hypothetical protein
MVLTSQRGFRSDSCCLAKVDSPLAPTLLFVKPNVAPFLTDHYPNVTLKGSDNPIVAQTRHFGHRVISTVSAFAIAETSSSTGSR